MCGLAVAIGVGATVLGCQGVALADSPADSPADSADSRSAPSYQNKLFVADWAEGWIKVLTCADDFSSCGNPTTFDPDAGLTVSLIQGPDGNIYQLTYDLYFPGALYRIAPVS